MIDIDETTRRILVVGAHPDDETACGGLVARLADRGHEIHHYYFSDCAKSTKARGHSPGLLLEECEKSRNYLGVGRNARGGFTFPVREFPENRQSILDTLIDLRKTIDPSIILTAATDDIHQDHFTLTRETIRAFKNATILGYEMPWNQFTAHHDCFVKLEQSHLDRKLSAIAAYKTQSKSPYVEPEFVLGLARVRGVQAGCQYAESYQVIRMVI